MLTTHKEAGNKLCPVADRVCKSDQCMAWRSAHDHQGFCGMAGKPSQVVVTEALASWRIISDEQANGGEASSAINSLRYALSLIDEQAKDGAAFAAESEGGHAD